MIFYFSGTGNSLWVARQIAERLDDELVSMTDKIDRTYTLKENERVGFVFPVYAWGPPTCVIDFISRVRIEKPTYLYFICTCGDDTGKTGEVFSKAISKRGWKCMAGYSITMPNTYVCLPGFNVDDKDLEYMKIENAQERIKFIADELAKRIQMSKFNCHEGAFPNLKTYVIRPFFHSFLMSPKLFHATDACTSCRMCEKKCPTHNIKVNRKPQWGENCTHCLACYHVCPFKAIQYGNRTHNKGQYQLKESKS